VKVLKIDRYHLNKIANIYRAHDDEAKISKEKMPAQDQDKVILSKKAQELQAAAKNGQDIQGSTEDRAKRIAEVKSLIEKGEYHVDSKLVARKMIENALYKKRV